MSKQLLTVIWQNMDVSFMIAFVATILQFLIAIPLGIKAARNQYGVIDYTVSILSMAGISSIIIQSPRNYAIFVLQPFHSFLDETELHKNCPYAKQNYRDECIQYMQP